MSADVSPRLAPRHLIAGLIAVLLPLDYLRWRTLGAI